MSTIFPKQFLFYFESIVTVQDGASSCPALFQRSLKLAHSV